MNDLIDRYCIFNRDFHCKSIGMPFLTLEIPIMIRKDAFYWNIILTKTISTWACTCDAYVAPFIYKLAIIKTCMHKICPMKLVARAWYVYIHRHTCTSKWFIDWLFIAYCSYGRPGTTRLQWYFLLCLLFNQYIRGWTALHLTHWSQDKMFDVLQTAFSRVYLERKILQFDTNFTEVGSL